MEKLPSLASSRRSSLSAVSTRAPSSCDDSPRTPSTCSSHHEERCAGYAIEQFWSLLETFGRMDRSRVGIVGRVDFLSACQEFGADLEFQRMLRKTGLTARFHSSAKDLTLGKFINIILPRATTVDLTRASRWADLWKARRALETCGMSGEPDALRSLFGVLDEASKGTVATTELVRARLFSHDEVLAFLPPRRGCEPLNYEDFRLIVEPALRKKFKTQNDEFASLPVDWLKHNLKKCDVFKNILAMPVNSVADGSEVEEMLSAELCSSAWGRPKNLPRLPMTPRAPPEGSPTKSGRTPRAPPEGSPSKTGRRKPMTPRANIPPCGGEPSSRACNAEFPGNEQPVQRFETARAKTARTLCIGKAGDDCFRQCDFLKDCTPLFLSFLMDELQCEMFMPGDVIIREGDTGDKIFFLRRGDVEVVVGPECKKVAELKEGVAFGEMALFEPSGKRSATIRAIDFCDCRSLNQRTFFRLLQCFPEDKEFFRKMAQQRRGALHKSPEKRSNHRANSGQKTARNLLSAFDAH